MSPINRFLVRRTSEDDGYELYDYETAAVVFDDRMEPEDVSLKRGLDGLVVLINRLAEERDGFVGMFNRYGFVFMNRVHPRHVATCCAITILQAKRKR